MDKITLLAVVSLIAAVSIPSLSMSQHSHWQAPAKEASRENPVPADKASLARGKKLYRAHCAACHGEQGRGDGPAGTNLEPRPTDLSHVAGHHKDGDLAWKIAAGRGAMPGWKGVLKEDQIWDVVNYLKSLYSPGSHGTHGEHH
ncbi:MAG: hypothetical protein A2078_08580 [Nitrospirae bacterium GWC2_57_9]|nr:MAG: hypothetical protein A2078_08580 [Nitrospirae bacterium GWC2_57_9]